jgi:hypothetical protein
MEAARENNAENLWSSTAMEPGQLGTGCVMLTRCPAVGPNADMQMRSLPLSSGTTIYLTRASNNRHGNCGKHVRTCRPTTNADE